MKWRLIPFGHTEAALNMAVDESIMEHVAIGKSLPSIRFYGWMLPAVTIGTFQCREDEVDVELAARKNMSVVRRITGGGAVYHDKEITYSITGPLRYFEKDILKSYEQICDYVIRALVQLGIPAVFRPINDIWVNGRKISGSAQTRRNGVLMQHGTVLLDVDADSMFSVLKVNAVKASDKFIRSVKKAVTSIAEENPGTSKKEVLAALQHSFCRGKEIVAEDISLTELRRAKELAVNKYSAESWNRGKF